jgi:hypothetical protein
VAPGGLGDRERLSQEGGFLAMSCRAPGSVRGVEEVAERALLLAGL